MAYYSGTLNLICTVLEAAAALLSLSLSMHDLLCQLTSSLTTLCQLHRSTDSSALFTFAWEDYLYVFLASRVLGTAREKDNSLLVI